MNKIIELFESNDSVLVFDIDGVLALMEWGEYNHFVTNTDKWNEICNSKTNIFNEQCVIKKMQDFIKRRNNERIYVISAISNQNEANLKTEFVHKYYNILNENIYYVYNETEKKSKIKKIKEKYPDLNDRYIIMIDDSTSVLTDIMKNTNFSTMHISSFLDLTI